MYCKMNSHKPLPLLVEEFKENHPILKTMENTHFYKYPFLRDQLFLSFFRNLKPGILSEFQSFTLKAQAEYFKRFINPEFNLQTLLKPSENVSKCPFAPKSTSTTTTPQLCCESLSKVRYSMIENTHISDMNFDNLTVNIVKPGSEMSSNAKFHVLHSGTHNYLDLNNPDAQIIMLSDAKLTDMKFMKSDHQESQTINELFKVKKVFTASDALFLFPAKIMVISPENLNILLNIIVYLNILKIPLSLNVLKSMGLSAKQLAPSSLEPYADLLSPLYIQNNPDLFQ